MTWQNNNQYPEGILVISTKDGILIGINVKALKEYHQTQDTDSLYIFSFILAEGQSIDCLQFNCFKEDLLATGSRELFVINFASDLNQPDIFCPLENPDPQRHFTGIAWNKSKTVQHIMAVGLDDG